MTTIPSESMQPNSPIRQASGDRPECGAQTNAIGANPADGSLLLPLLTVDLATYRSNRDHFLRLASAYGAKVAPHAKTPMCPEIAIDLVGAGAWGATVADLFQAEVLLGAGVTNVLIANQIGGVASARRLRVLADAFPHAEIACCVDSEQAAANLVQAFAGRAGDPFKVFVEVGAGRTGARTKDVAAEIVETLSTGAEIMLAGVSTYEGSVVGATSDVLDANMGALFDLVAETFAIIRRKHPERALVISAGGSIHFDRVIAALAPVCDADGNATLLLRSGAIFFADHGVYKRGFESIDARRLLMPDGFAFIASKAFKPAMRIWAEVISVPESGLAIVGMGMRDVSFDQDLPVALSLYRDGRMIEADLASSIKVSKLNDQHAFVTFGNDAELAIGDVMEFGISHPCTCFDRWRVFYGIDASGRIERSYRTFFH
ncbi:amino acid deaminase [Phyllobacterium sp. 0TCS1.6C]|uniref:amino acid deaminase n=1 Tax=unclassified Phyllobacterium TaxID=2638441 RepID=UPI0022652576|nr:MULTISPECIES: amino acid deaminase [unclassified Phyllobacterium]MCX8281105.1 amino acid deaminase [Phyllobacterium sp. 0TCS1.6C]MCX8294608.1 amino acid deaminase [Phyllobacterium sp. 0TCS1.6A]